MTISRSRARGDTYRSRSEPYTCVWCWSRPSYTDRFLRRVSLLGGLSAPTARCYAVCRLDSARRLWQRACQLQPVWRLVLPMTKRRCLTMHRLIAWPSTIQQRHLSSKSSSRQEAEKVHPLRDTSQSAGTSTQSIFSQKLIERFAEIHASNASGNKFLTHWRVFRTAYSHTHAQTHVHTYIIINIKGYTDFSGAFDFTVPCI